MDPVAKVLELSGYIQQEKLEISKKYLIPKILKETGLKKNQLNLSDDISSILSLFNLKIANF